MTWPNPNTHPDYYDPFATADRHPQLPAGWNADDMNGDMIDGPGTNWDIWPVFFEAYQGFEPLIITDEMQEVFDGCPDYAVSAFVDTYIPPANPSPWLVGGTWPDIVPPPINTTIQIPWQPRDVHARPPEPAIMPRGGSQTITLTDELNEQEARRAR